MTIEFFAEKKLTACYELLVIVNSSLMTFCCGEVSECEDQFLVCDPFPAVSFQVLESWGVTSGTIAITRERWFNTRFIHSIVKLGVHNE